MGCVIDDMLWLILLLMSVSNLGDDRDDTLPRDVPFRLLDATDRLRDSSMLAILRKMKILSTNVRFDLVKRQPILTFASNVCSVAILGF